MGAVYSQGAPLSINRRGLGGDWWSNRPHSAASVRLSSAGAGVETPTRLVDLAHTARFTGDGRGQSCPGGLVMASVCPASQKL